jgi:hypothetical protein
MDGATVVVAVARIGRVAAALAPDELDRLPVDRHRDRARRGGDGLELLVRAVAERRRLIDAEGTHPVWAKPVLEPGDVGALRQPQPTVPAAEAAPVPRDAGRDLEIEPGVGRQQRQHGMGGGGGPELDRAAARGVAEAPEQVAARRLDRVRGARVVRCRAANLSRQPVLADPLEALGVLLVDPLARVAQIFDQPLAGRTGQRLELVAEHRRQPERQRRRRLLDQVEQRQVDAGDGLPEPLLAKRPGAEALDVRHVRVQDEAERAPVATHRRTATRSSAPSSEPERSVKSLAAIAGVNQS